MQIVTPILILSAGLLGALSLQTGLQTSMESRQIEILVPIEMAVANVIKANAPYVFNMLQSTIDQLYDEQTALQVIGDLGTCYEDFADRFYRGIDIAEFDVYNFDGRCGQEDQGAAVRRLLGDLLWVMDYFAAGCQDYLSVDLMRDLNRFQLQSGLQGLQTWGVPSATVGEMELVLLGLVALMPQDMQGVFNATLTPTLQQMGMDPGDQALFIAGLAEVLQSTVAAFEDSYANPYDSDEVEQAAADLETQWDNTVDGMDQMVNALIDYAAGLQATICGAIAVAGDELRIDLERLTG